MIRLLQPLFILIATASYGDAAAAHDGHEAAAKAALARQVERIEAHENPSPDGSQVGVNALIAYDPLALDRALPDCLHTALNCRTVLVKDNIETFDFPTTAGSLALLDNDTGRDAPLVARIRGAGGVIAGKTNLSEWANIRDANSTSGWSAVGGLTRNPHATDRNACGSSSGSGAAVAAGFAWAAVGTETDGSITCPASVNGVVGFKPTVGLVSRRHIVPISSSQDTAGPMARSVADAALLLTAMAGTDPSDPATRDADARMTDYAAGLEEASLEGVRIGVLVDRIGDQRLVRQLFGVALADLERAGAVLVDVPFTPDPTMSRNEFAVLMFELRREMDAYLSSLPKPEGADRPLPRSLTDLVAFNDTHNGVEQRFFGQSLFRAALDATDEKGYRAARFNALQSAGPQGIDRLLAEHDVAMLIAPTTGPAWATDLVLGDNYTGGIGAGSLAAIAGYPHLTVPMGAADGLPVGISFIGAKWTDHDILKAGAAYERVRSATLSEPSFAPWRAAHANPDLSTVERVPASDD